MRIAALLQAFAFFICLYTLLLAVGVRLLRKKSLTELLQQQERDRFHRRFGLDHAEERADDGRLKA